VAHQGEIKDGGIPDYFQILADEIFQVAPGGAERAGGVFLGFFSHGLDKAAAIGGEFLVEIFFESFTHLPCLVTLSAQPFQVKALFSR
jgi:hypothetical protein